jgi:hypothetical protein
MSETNVSFEITGEPVTPISLTLGEAVNCKHWGDNFVSIMIYVNNKLVSINSYHTYRNTNFHKVITLESRAPLTQCDNDYPLRNIDMGGHRSGWLLLKPKKK